jgi:two-component system nitrogen regulation response regulator NtrX
MTKPESPGLPTGAGNVERTRVLIIDDEASIREVLGASLGDEGFEVRAARTGAEGLEMLREYEPGIVLLDIWMPGSMDGLEVLSRARSEGVQAEFVMMSGHGTIETAVKATKLGAWDFLEKPLSIDKVLIVLKNIIQVQVERTEKTALLGRLRKTIAMVGDSPAMRNVRQLVTRVAPSSSWVLVTGENGVGKDLVAQNIHYLSPRAGRPFVEVNCAAIPEDLIESDLFGFEANAFPGQSKARRGKFDLAQGGTLFLDEIADMPLRMQGLLLRVLEERVFQRVGSEEKIRADVRVIAATNRDLETEIKAGRFRQDLFYRLNVIPFHVPALRERAGDIPQLIQFFAEQFSRQSGERSKTVSPAAMSLLQKYEWPGNVRELRNFVERLDILTPTEVVDIPDLRYAGLPRSEMDRADDLTLAIESFREARARFERDYLIRKIAENRGNISRTAESIGLERSYLHRKIKSYEIEVDNST